MQGYSGIECLSDYLNLNYEDLKLNVIMSRYYFD